MIIIVSCSLGVFRIFAISDISDDEFRDACCYSSFARNIDWQGKGRTMRMVYIYIYIYMTKLHFPSSSRSMASSSSSLHVCCIMHQCYTDVRFFFLVSFTNKMMTSWTATEWRRVIRRCQQIASGAGSKLPLLIGLDSVHGANYVEVSHYRTKYYPQSVSVNFPVCALTIPYRF